MITSKPKTAFIGAGVFSAIAASLCCITPVIALLAGSGSLAANFSWIEPARPYLIVLSIAVLALAWYAKLKPAKANDPDCSCETKNSHSFLQSKSFLGIITVFSIMMMTFPLYAKIFYHAPEVKSYSVAKTEGKLTAIFIIDGMTCAGCEVTVNNELSKLKGVWNYTTSYALKNSQVTYNPEIIDVKTIASAINKTGYTVKKWKIQ